MADEAERKGQEDASLEYWEIEEKKEGYDVYDYDARRATRGLVVTLSIFVLAAALFVWAIWFSYRIQRKDRGKAGAFPRSTSRPQRFDSPITSSGS